MKTKITMLHKNSNGNDTFCATCNKKLKGGNAYPALVGSFFFCNDTHAKKGMKKLGLVS